MRYSSPPVAPTALTDLLRRQNDLLVSTVRTQALRRECAQKRLAIRLAFLESRLATSDLAAWTAEMKTKKDNSR